MGFSSVEDHLANMATGVVDFLGFDSPPQGRGAPPPFQQAATYAASANVMVDNNAVDYASIEHPVVVLCREEKTAELFQRCAMLGTVDAGIIRAVSYRWIVCAAHNKDPYLDPMIPSWTGFDALADFLQRQLCHDLAKDLVGFRSKIEEQVPQDWADSTIIVGAKEVTRNGGGSIVAEDWADHAQVFVDRQVFVSMKERHTGLPSRFCPALFGIKKQYNTMRMVVNRIPMDFRLGSSTKVHLSQDARVSVELWVDPFRTFGTHSFCGFFAADVDPPFGGLPPFGNDVGQ